MNCVVETHKVEQCPHERKFSSGMDTASSDTKDKFPDGKSKSVDYHKPQKKKPLVWRPAESVDGITKLMTYHHARNTLMPENLLELDPPKDQLEREHKQILSNSKTKAWVDEQNRINKEKDTPQPAHALQEFVKHIANPLVDKGWNLHLKFGKSESQENSLFKAHLHGNPQLKLIKKKKLVNPK